ncbi:MAG: hypothetical protein DSY89_09985 [Deltaproteobacteria bacterium]|nr:MAG: hypothetical protein DSY89_09985 [Deltaproteobacteria bacterium]
MTKWITVWMAFFFLTGCARVVIAPPSGSPTSSAKPPQASTPPTRAPVPSRQPAPTLRPPVEKPGRKLPPRAIAALKLTEQGKILIKRKKPDAAIRTLERALNLYPKNGKTYYYLAEAWLQKGDTGQAAEFNQLARIYLQKDSDWASRIKSQQLKIKGR